MVVSVVKMICVSVMIHLDRFEFWLHFIWDTDSVMFDLKVSLMSITV